MRSKRRRGGTDAFSADFAGTIISCYDDATGFKCETLNKNWVHLKETGEQKIGRFPPSISYTHIRTKLGVLIGSINRIGTQNTCKRTLLKHIARNLFEMKALGYDKSFLNEGLFTIRKKANWTEIADTMLNFVNTNMY